jgi:hypothetical protein
VPVDPLLLAELVALLVDGLEVVREQIAEAVGVAAQLCVVEGPLELEDVVCHSANLPRSSSPARRDFFHWGRNRRWARDGGNGPLRDPGRGHPRVAFRFGRTAV